MKILCTCGATIYVQRDSLSYVAHFHSNQDMDDIYDAFRILLDKFAEAVKHSTTDDATTYTKIRTEAARDFARISFEFDRNVYQCTNCGRLWVEDIDRHRLHEFEPAPEIDKNVLRSVKSPQE